MPNSGPVGRDAPGSGPFPDNAQRARAAREANADALEAQRYLGSGTPTGAAAEATATARELRDNVVRP